MFVCLMKFNATFFNNISALLWRSVLMVKEARRLGGGGGGGKHRTVAIMSLTNCITKSLQRMMLHCNALYFVNKVDN